MSIKRFVRAASVVPLFVAVAVSGSPAAIASGLDPAGLLPEPVGEGLLGSLRAREDSQALRVGQIGRITERAAVQDNIVIGGQSGTNILGAGALDNARGIATVIQNSGHNVVIQDSLIVNVTVTP